MWNPYRDPEIVWCGGDGGRPRDTRYVLIKYAAGGREYPTVGWYSDKLGCWFNDCGGMLQPKQVRAWALRTRDASVYLAYNEAVHRAALSNDTRNNRGRGASNEKTAGRESQPNSELRDSELRNKQCNTRNKTKATHEKVPP